MQVFDKSPLKKKESSIQALLLEKLQNQSDKFDYIQTFGIFIAQDKRAIGLGR